MVDAFIHETAVVEDEVFCGQDIQPSHACLSEGKCIL